MKYIVIVLLILLPSICFGEDWDSIDKALLYPLIGSKIIDCSQTIQIYENNKSERNLIIQKGVEQFGELFIPFYFAAQVSAIYLVANDLSSPYRKFGLSVLLGSSLLYVSHNIEIGIGFAIPF